MAYFDRYSLFRSGDNIGMVSYGEIPVKPTDIYEEYKKGLTRLDQVSYQYYGSPDYAWLILQANPKYGSMEFSIPDGSILRIPFPLETSIHDYIESISQHKKFYG